MGKIGRIEYELDENDILYFLHIPKTAGTSLTNILETLYNFKEIYQDVLWIDLFKKLPMNLGDYKLLRGHFGYWITKILPKSPVIVTMLRKPLDQTLSLYAHQLRSFANGAYSMLETGNETLSEIFEDPKKSIIFTNHQIRHLTLELRKETIDLIKHQKLKKNLIKNHKPRLPTNKQAELLETAKNRLMECVFFGLTERFEDSLFLLYYTFGWFPAVAAPRLNISSNKKKIDDLPEETQKKLIQATYLDKQLYDFGEKIFEKRYQDMITDLKSKYSNSNHEKMSFSEMMYDMLQSHFYERNKDFDLEFKNTVNFGFGQKMIGAGWQQREKLDEDTVFRWSGPELRSDVYFALTEDIEFKIKVFIVMQISKEVLDSLKMEVNGKQIPLKQTNGTLNFGKNKKIELEGIIPKSYINTSQKLTKISFLIDKTISAKDVDNKSTDERKLGLAFSRIKIEPN